MDTHGAAVLALVGALALVLPSRGAPHGALSAAVREGEIPDYAAQVVS